MLQPNNHKIKCRCKKCWCDEHQFSLRRPTKPPHTWMYDKCPLCKKQNASDTDIPEPVNNISTRWHHEFRCNLCQIYVEITAGILPDTTCHLQCPFCGEKIGEAVVGEGKFDR
jgi:hypothetical protein